MLTQTELTMKVTFLFPVFLLTLAMALPSCRDTQPNVHSGTLLPRGEVEHLDRFEHEIQAFELADKTEMPTKGSILFTGSSSIRLWESLASDFAPLSVINRGFGGSTIPEVNYYADRIVHKYAPNLIVFYCGENDIVEEHPAAVVFQDFKKFIGETEKNLSGASVIFISAKPSPSRWANWRQFQVLNGMVKQFADGRPNLGFIDISETLLGENGEPDPTLFIKDMLHLNKRGYERWTAAIRPLVEQIYEGKATQ